MSAETSPQALGASKRLAIPGRLELPTFGLGIGDQGLTEPIGASLPITAMYLKVLWFFASGMVR